LASRLSLLAILPHPTSPLFPYTTLFRSLLQLRRILLLQHADRGRRREHHRNLVVLHDLPPDAGIWWKIVQDYEVSVMFSAPTAIDRKSTRLNSSHRTISYAVFCLKKKKK